MARSDCKRLFFSIEIRHKGILVLNMSVFARGKLYKVRVPRVGIISLAGAATSIIFVAIKGCRDKYVFVATKDVFCRDKYL